jgi:tetratricopeptide (TPR) repeat protein
MTTNSDRSKLAQISALQRDAARAEAAGRVSETAALLQEIVRLDPRDHRTLHRLGELHAARLNRPHIAASWYAREARCHEREGALARAVAVWRIAARCDPMRFECHERIGAIYVELGRLADARDHFETAAAALQHAGLRSEAAILRAQLAASLPAQEAESAPEAPAGPPAVAPARTPMARRDDTKPPLPQLTPDPVQLTPDPAQLTPDPLVEAEARDLAAERFQNARLLHHYGLHQPARRQLEDLLTSLPDHVEARQLLVEVCRAVGAADEAAQHLRVLTDLLRRQGDTEVPADGAVRTLDPASESDLPPIEEWMPGESERDWNADLMEEIRDDVERVVDGLERRERRR